MLYDNISHPDVHGIRQGFPMARAARVVTYQDHRVTILEHLSLDFHKPYCAADESIQARLCTRQLVDEGLPAKSNKLSNFR
jgi:hypothetical protein